MASKVTQESRQVAIATSLGEDVLLVKRAVLSEELGELFEMQLELVSEKNDIPFDELLGRNVTLRLSVGAGETRYFNGLVSKFRQVARDGGVTEYHATVVPWLWLLTRTSDCRIYQEQDVPTIIKDVFRRHGFTDFEERLSGVYRTWEYCVQYRETDFNFVSRLMEQEGIYYFFTHENGKHTLVLADSPTAHSATPGYEAVEYHQPDEVIADREFITSWDIDQDVQPGVIELKDFDFKNPADLLESKSRAEVTHEQGGFAVFDYPGEYVTSGEGDAYARIRQEEMHARRVSVSCESDCRGIAVGARVKVLNAPRRDLGDEFVVISATYAIESETPESGGGGGGAPFAVSFQMIPASRQFRPARLTSKPLIQGPQTAIVVGKSGEEIWTDEHGRVKLQFHWDRYSKGDENSSCWVRVSQNWAGKRWGVFFQPRIGQEVIVEFLEGDPDRPIITGRVYNGQNMPPYKPDSMGTISTIKSNSSKGGGGFNEIRFEDKKDEEQVFIHAQKNMDIRVLNDRFETIMNDRHLVVENDKHEHVKHDRHETVDNDHFELVGRDKSITVTGEHAEEITGTRSIKVTGDVAEVFESNQSTEVTKDLYIKAENICIEAVKNLTLKVGKTSIALEASGIGLATTGDVKAEAKKGIELKATTEFKAEGTTGVSVKGLKVDVKADTTATVEGGAAATVKASGALTLQGGIVKIN